MKQFFIWLISVYQKTLSPFIGQQCRFYPTCSQYTKDAINTHGSFKGVCLGLSRIARCQPFAKGGYDPVPENQTLSANNQSPELRNKKEHCCHGH